MPTRRPRLSLLAVATASAAVVLYALTSAPTVTFGGDCGELAAAVRVWGIAHPTGYPLYLLLAKAVTGLLPGGSYAWQVGFLSVLAAALCVGLVTWQVRAATDDHSAGWFAGTALLFAAAFWSQAVIAEVYALHLFLLAANLAAHQEWLRTRDQRWLNVIGLLYGAGLAHHLSTVLLVPGTVLLLLTARPRPGLLPALLRIAGWAVPPLGLYAYLPVRAALQPALNWGDPSTPERFLAHVTGRSYRGLLGSSSLPEMLRYARVTLFFWFYDLRWAVPLALLGWLTLDRQRRPLGWCWLGLGTAALAFAAAYKVGDRSNYALPLYLVTALAAGSGAAWLRARLSDERRNLPRATLLGIAVGLLPLLPSPPEGGAAARVGFDRCNQAGNRRAATLARATLGEAGPGSRLLVLSDELAWACWYLQVAEEFRRDVVVEPLGEIDSARGRANLQAVLQRAAAAGDVQAAFWDPLLARQSWEMGQFTLHLRTGATPAEVALGPDQPAAAQVFPWSAAWGLADARLSSAVSLPGQPPAVGLKPRTLARLGATLVAGQPGPPCEVLLWLVQRSGGPFLNNSSRSVQREFIAWLPFEPSQGGYQPAPGRSVELAWPVTLPASCAPGRWEVRLGVVPATAAAHARLASAASVRQAATLPVGELLTWEQ